MVKLIFSFVALVIALLMVFVFPGAGWEETVITVVASIAAQFGLTSWRKQFELAKAWFKSKTIVGALLIVVPILVLVILPLLGVALSPLVITILSTLVAAGGGTTLWGIFDTDKSKMVTTKF